MGLGDLDGGCLHGLEGLAREFRLHSGAVTECGELDGEAGRDLHARGLHPHRALEVVEPVGEPIVGADRGEGDQHGVDTAAAMDVSAPRELPELLLDLDELLLGDRHLGTGPFRRRRGVLGVACSDGLPFACGVQACRHVVELVTEGVEAPFGLVHVGRELAFLPIELRGAALELAQTLARIPPSVEAAAGTSPTTSRTPAIGPAIDHRHRTRAGPRAGRAGLLIPVMRTPQAWCVPSRHAGGPYPRNSYATVVDCTLGPVRCR